MRLVQFIPKLHIWLERPQLVSAYLRPYDTHALEDAVGNLRKDDGCRPTSQGLHWCSCSSDGQQKDEKSNENVCSSVNNFRNETQSVKINGLTRESRDNCLRGGMLCSA
jgi:hypothetical protein